MIFSLSESYEKEKIGPLCKSADEIVQNGGSLQEENECANYLDVCVYLLN